MVAAGSTTAGLRRRHPVPWVLAALSALAGLMAAAGVVAFLAAGRRPVAVPIGALLAGVAVVACVGVLADAWGAALGWIAAVVVTAVGVRTARR